MDVTFKPKIDRKDDESLIQCTAEDYMYRDFIRIRSRIKFEGYDEMCQFVKKNIISILSSAIDKNPRSLQVITSKEFLTAMDMLNITLNQEYTNRFNRVYRAYVINPSRNAIYNQTNADMLYKIALKLNRGLTTTLMSLGLAENIALWIVVNRYSSTDERRNIRRMVRAMQHTPPIIMTEQMVVDIFSKTFNDQLTNLFVSIMTDRFDVFDSDGEKYVYSTISNAILDILNTMNEEEIEDILMEYTDELRKSGVSGRFALKSINSGDYGPICRAIDELESRGVKIK